MMIMKSFSLGRKVNQFLPIVVNILASTRFIKPDIIAPNFSLDLAAAKRVCLSSSEKLWFPVYHPRRL